MYVTVEEAIKAGALGRRVEMLRNHIARGCVSGLQSCVPEPCPYPASRTSPLQECFDCPTAKTVTRPASVCAVSRQTQ